MYNEFEFAGVIPDTTIDRKEINLITEKSYYVVAETKKIYQHRKNGSYFHYRYLISVEEYSDGKWKMELYLNPMPSSLKNQYQNYPVRISHKFINAPRYSDKVDAFISYIILVASCIKDIDANIDNYLDSYSDTEGKTMWELLYPVLNIKNVQPLK